jgi:hypothetical protein
MRRQTGRQHAAARAAALACALFVGCALAKGLGVAAGQGALEGFSTQMYEKDGQDSWGNAYSVSGRGVGVGTRAAAADPIDCSAVSDEFLELYGADLLRRLRGRVATIDGTLSKERFDALAQTPFRMNEARHGGAIGVAQTTSGRVAKFVVVFSGEGDGARLELHDVTVYESGSGAVVRAAKAPLELPSRVAIDLDGMPGEPAYDLRFGPDPSGVPTLAAASGAGLSFPTASLCESAKP